MNKLTLIVVIALIAVFGQAVHAATLFSESFETYPVTWNLPSGSPWAHPTYVVSVNNSPVVTGQDGSNYLEIDNAGTSAAPESDTIATNGTADAAMGTFQANTTYSLTVLMQCGAGGTTNGPLFSGTISLLDATTSTAAGSFTENFGSAPDANFHSYTVTVDTATQPGLVGHTIGISLTASQTTLYFHAVSFDKVALTATPDVPPGMSYIGVNIEKDWLYTDVIRQAAHSQWNISTDLWNTTPAAAATVDSNGWPTQDCSLALWGTTAVTGNVQNNGTYTVVFNGIAKVTTFPGYVVSPVNSDGTNGTYNASTNTTTATFVDTSASAENVAIIFANTKRTSSSATNTGITNVHVYRPTSPGATTSFAVGTLFTPVSLSVGEKFSTSRFLDLTAAINSTQVNWVDRNIPAFWCQNGGGIHPMSYEYAVAYCNATNTDLYLNIPYHASDAYVTNLAKLIKYGSDGVNPYSSTQASPVWAPLNSNLHVYFELSDEVWNSIFQQMHDNYNAVVADQTANNAEWNILNYDGASASNLWTGAWRLIGLKGLQFSNDFRAVYGDTAMPPYANCTVRPLFEFQAQNGQSTGTSALHFLDNYYNNSDGVAHVTTPHPMNYYFWGAGGATYFKSNNDAATTVDAIFASGIPATGYSLMIQTDAAVAKSYGLKRVAYEGGWALQNGTSTDNPAGGPASLAKYDTRATAVLQNAITSFEQTGGDLNVFYCSSSWDTNYVWGMTDSVFDLDVPLYAAVTAIDNSAPAAVTYGNPIAGTGATTLPYASKLIAESNSNSGLADNGALGYVPLISVGGNYQISLNINSTAAGKYVKVLVDGNVVGGTINVPVSSTAQNVVVATVNLTPGQHGLIIRGQYTSNNNYTGNSCTFTSVVLTKVP